MIERMKAMTKKEHAKNQVIYVSNPAYEKQHSKKKRRDGFSASNSE